jgi:hypothetical protein
MKKIRLDPETLAVQSFATVGLPRARGTVRGAQDVVPAPTREYGCRESYPWCESGDCAYTPGCEDSEICVVSEVCVDSEICVDTGHDTCAGMVGC